MIPVVDLSDFLSGDASRKQKFVQELGKAYEDVGFVAVKNHGIPDNLIADLYKYVQEFFRCHTKKSQVMKRKTLQDKEATLPLAVNMLKVPMRRI